MDDDNPFVNPQGIKLRPGAWIHAPGLCCWSPRLAVSQDTDCHNHGGMAGEAGVAPAPNDFGDRDPSIRLLSRGAP